MFSHLKKIFKKYERYAMTVAFLFGFIIDNLTLRRVDLWLENLALIFYLTLAGAAILLFQAYNTGRLKWEIAEKGAVFLPLALQIVFGALFSAFFVFYLRSASLAASWFFLLFLASLLIGNEFFHTRYERLNFQMSIYFIALFSYFIFLVPIVLGKIGGVIFLLSGFISIAFFFFIYYLLRIITREQIEKNAPSLYASIGALYILFHILYFTNIIPPIPLSLTEGGIYHSIERIDGTYSARFEPAPWYAFLQKTDSEFHWKRGAPVYSYSSVFAPTKLRTQIIHHWSYFDEKKDTWITSSKIRFPIVGGRDGGYRGFTVKYGMRPGKWRVDVETERGQRLGRTAFHIIKTDLPPRLESTLLQ